MDIRKLIQDGESETLEFKASFDRETIEALSAFANSNGGTVLVGVNDKGKITGVQISGESIQKWINQIKSSTSPSVIPDVEKIDHRDKTLVAMSVPSYPVKPISCKGKYYKRRHNANHLMDLNETESNFLIPGVCRTAYI